MEGAYARVKKVGEACEDQAVEIHGDSSES